MKNLIFSDKIKMAAPRLRVIMIEAEVDNPPTSDSLWEEIEKLCGEISHRYELPQINKRPAIAATREAYKALGKDPNRYRPSSEALMRRVVQGKGLYRLTTLIDIVNLISVASGYSIGGFDEEKIQGDTLILDAGRHDDIYNGIGRGLLNIEGLPVYRDAAGGIGTPTSDEERTKLTSETKHLLMLVNIYGEEMPAEEVIDLTKDVLQRHAALKAFNVSVHSVG